MMMLLFAAALAALAPEPPGAEPQGKADAQVERPVERGVSEALAAERAASVRDLRYELHFTVPADRREAVRGRAVARLTLAAPHRLVFDFAQPSDRIARISVNGRELRPGVANGHILVPAAATRSGQNEIVFEFVAGDDALNR